MMVFKQGVLFTLYTIGDLISVSFLCRWEFGGDLYQFFMMKYFELRDKWNVDF